MLSAHWELDRDTSLKKKKKSSESILLLSSSEIQHCYISHPVARIHSQQYLLLGKHCPIDGPQT